MNEEALLHTQTPPDVWLTEKNRLRIQIRAARKDLLQCELVFFTRTSPERKRRIDMQCRIRDGLADYYEAAVLFPETARYLKYYFELTDHDGEKRWLNSWGVWKQEPEDGYFEFLYANEGDCFRLPSWAAGQVFYQIFPERFCNGDTGNDPEGCSSWGSRPTRENYMGGDLAGIRSRLWYLEKLGVQCLYLTPIFRADFNHKYATADYFTVDPAFGSMDELKGLVRDCHEKNIRIILDGVFNHCGIHFPPFADLLEKQEGSAYKDWFLVNRFPVEVSAECYDCVGAYPFMPKLNTSNAAVREYITGIMRYWMKETGIDGWRLDVADEADMRLWEQARQTLKEEFPDCLLLGETWGSGAKLFRGNRMDSIMNYGFRDAVRDYLTADRPDAVYFDNRLHRVYAYYPKEIRDGLYGLLDSHDTPRFYTLCKKDIKRMKLAAALLLTLPGAPAVYYGDEAGMEGENDPDCRRAFLWEKRPWEGELFAWYRELIQLRKENDAFQTGGFRTNICGEGTFGFIRDGRETIFYVIVNAGGERTLKVPVTEDGACRAVFPDMREEGVFTVLPGRQSTPFYNDDITAYAGCIVCTAPEWSVFVIKQQKNKKEEEV